MPPNFMNSPLYTVETNSSTIIFENDGVLRIIKKPNSYENLEDARENIKVINNMCRNKKHVALVDLRLLKDQEDEAIIHYSENAKRVNCTALALLVDSENSICIGIANKYMSGAAIITEIFKSESVAYNWLLKKLS